jgi:hypothetical protein
MQGLGPPGHCALENAMMNRAIRATSPDADGLSRMLDA